MFMKFRSGDFLKNLHHSSVKTGSIMIYSLGTSIAKAICVFPELRTFTTFAPGYASPPEFSEVLYGSPRFSRVLRCSPQLSVVLYFSRIQPKVMDLDPSKQLIFDRIRSKVMDLDPSKHFFWQNAASQNSLAPGHPRHLSCLFLTPLRPLTLSQTV